MTRTLFVFLILAFTQITGWGVIGFLPVLTPVIAGDLHVAIPTIFLGTAAMYVVMGLAAPPIGKAFRRFGGKNVMAAGAVLIAVGLAIVSVAGSIAIYLAAWALLGIAGAMFLTTAAYIYLSDYADERARGMIGSLMLVTGLAGSVFWPWTAYLQHLVGWRAAIQIYSGIALLVVVPLIVFGLPEARSAAGPDDRQQQPARRTKTFWFLVAAVALNSFVTYGMEAIGIELFHALGAAPSFAVGIASLLGVLKVSGRLIDLVGGKRWDALSTGVVAGAMIPLGFIVLLAFGGGAAAVSISLLLFGVGSGAFAVARATMPLVFFRKAEYAAAMSAIALPMNLTSAIAAPILSGLLTASGAPATLTLMIICSTTALVLLLRLGSLKRRELEAASSNSVQA